MPELLSPPSLCRTPRSGPRRSSGTLPARASSPVTGPSRSMPGTSGVWSPLTYRSRPPMSPRTRSWHSGDQWGFVFLLTLHLMPFSKLSPFSSVLFQGRAWGSRCGLEWGLGKWIDGREGAKSEMLPGFSQESRAHSTAQLAPQLQPFCPLGPPTPQTRVKPPSGLLCNLAHLAVSLCSVWSL